MKKGDLTKGRWYNAPNWASINIQALKFSHLDERGRFVASHEVKNNIYSKSRIIWDCGSTSFTEVTLLEIQQYLPKDQSTPRQEYETKEGCEGKEEIYFPAEGCYFDVDNELVNYLHSKNYTIHPSYHGKTHGNRHIKWSAFHYWYISSASQSVKNYTTQQIKQLINLTTNKNEIPSIKTENSRSVIVGTIGIRSRRQQGSTGSRPEGNKACIIKSRAKSVSVKVSKNVVKLRNS